MSSFSTLAEATTANEATSSKRNVVAFVVEVGPLPRATEVRHPRNLVLRDATRTATLKLWGHSLNATVSRMNLRSGDIVCVRGVTPNAFAGVTSLSLSVADPDQGQLNPITILSRIVGNAPRLAFPVSSEEAHRAEILVAWSVIDPFLCALRRHAEQLDATGSYTKNISNVEASRKREREEGPLKEGEEASSKEAPSTIAGTFHLSWESGLSLKSVIDASFAHADVFQVVIIQASVGAHVSTSLCNRLSIHRETLEQVLEYSLLMPDDFFSKLRCCEKHFGVWFPQMWHTKFLQAGKAAIYFKSESFGMMSDLSWCICGRATFEDAFYCSVVCKKNDFVSIPSSSMSPATTAAVEPSFSSLPSPIPPLKSTPVPLTFTFQCSGTPSKTGSTVIARLFPPGNKPDFSSAGVVVNGCLVKRPRMNSADTPPASPVLKFAFDNTNCSTDSCYTQLAFSSRKKREG
ncbi:hypothetical protein BC830DRAFT_1079895 [Chytriomyces sp. MP71]|nr:hypothetical protein BC830DRAFT_1079895 [Chytriomyces sp. MP71]